MHIVIDIVPSTSIAQKIALSFIIQQTGHSCNFSSFFVNINFLHVLKRAIYKL